MKLTKIASLLLVIVLISSVAFNIACKKKEYIDEKIGGCYDVDSPTYDKDIDYDDGTCQYAYVTAYEITQHPELDPANSGQDWDIIAVGNATKADLLLTVSEQSSGTVVFQSVEKSDQTYNVPAKWTTPTDMKLLNQNYDWTLYDNDVSGQELMASGVFNPIDLLSSGNDIITGDINALNDTTVLKLYYTLK